MFKFNTQGIPDSRQCPTDHTGRPQPSSAGNAATAHDGNTDERSRTQERYQGLHALWRSSAHGFRWRKKSCGLRSYAPSWAFPRNRPVKWQRIGICYLSLPFFKRLSKNLS